jgi:hypothetical protein
MKRCGGLFCMDLCELVFQSSCDIYVLVCVCVCVCHWISFDIVWS